MHRTLAMMLAGLVSVGTVGSAMAADLVLARADATELTAGNVGKPFWSLQAQCAGAFGAGYAYEKDHGNAKGADADKQAGVAMLEAAVARLQIDRGLDRNSAMALAIPEVDYGRGVVEPMLARGGNGPDADWNYMRSTCLDIDAAARAHLTR